MQGMTQVRTNTAADINDDGFPKLVPRIVCNKFKLDATLPKIPQYSSCSYRIDEHFQTLFHLPAWQVRTRSARVAE